jgi:hypothetical protein
MTKDGFVGYITRQENYRQENKRATVLAWVSMLGVILTIVGTVVIKVTQQ